MKKKVLVILLALGAMMAGITAGNALPDEQPKGEYIFVYEDVEVEMGESEEETEIAEETVDGFTPDILDAASIGE